MAEPFWKTSISKVEPNKILVRGYNLTDLVGRYKYADLTYLLCEENCRHLPIPK